MKSKSYQKSLHVMLRCCLAIALFYLCHAAMGKESYKRLDRSGYITQKYVVLIDSVEFNGTPYTMLYDLEFLDSAKKDPTPTNYTYINIKEMTKKKGEKMFAQMKELLKYVRITLYFKNVGVTPERNINGISDTIPFKNYKAEYKRTFQLKDTDKNMYSTTEIKINLANIEKCLFRTTLSTKLP